MWLMGEGSGLEDSPRTMHSRSATLQPERRGVAAPGALPGPTPQLVTKKG